MIITSINLNGLELVSDDYYFQLSGMHDIEKDIITNDLLTDGQAWGRSKNKSKSLVLNGWVLSDDAKMLALNKVLAPNGLKPLIINGMYICQVEVSNRISDKDNSHIISCQLTMPDPYFYAVNADSVDLGAKYSVGVIFGDLTGITFYPSKNMICPATGSIAVSGLTITVAADGTITINGTSTSTISIILMGVLQSKNPASSDPILLTMINGKPYAFSLTYISGSVSDVTSRCYVCNAGAIISAFNIAIQNISSNKVYTSTGQTVNDFYFWCPSGLTFTNYQFRLQFEQNSAPTNWVSFYQDSQGVVFGTASGESGTVTNEGNATAYPVITIVGACSGISIENLTTGETIAVNVSLADTDTLVIDCNPATRGVYLNGTQRMDLKPGSGWITCPPGDNVFSFSRNSLEDKRHCAVELKSRYI